MKTKSKSDLYDAAIERLIRMPWNDVQQRWVWGAAEHPDDESRLFAMCGPQLSGCGCPTMVRSGMPASTRELTKSIHRMRSIPECILELELLWEKGVSLARRRAALRGFARAQRLVDKVTGRTWK